MKRTISMFAAGLIAATLCTPAFAGRLITVDRHANVLEVDATSGRTVTLSTMDTGAIVSNALAYDPSSGTLYLSDTTNNVIRTLDPDTGVTTIVGEPFPGGSSGITALEFNTTTGTLYGARSFNGTNTFYEVDTTTALASEIATFAQSDPALAYVESTDTMYLMGGGPYGLYTIDCETGATSNIGSGIDIPTALAYDWDAGVMYAITNTFGINYLATIDLTTGATNQIGSMGAGLNMRAMAYVPEPASLAVLAVGSLVVLRRRFA